MILTAQHPMAGEASRRARTEREMTVKAEVTGIQIYPATGTHIITVRNVLTLALAAAPPAETGEEATP